jgi:hypothetical protein
MSKPGDYKSSDHVTSHNSGVGRGRRRGRGGRGRGRGRYSNRDNNNSKAITSRFMCTECKKEIDIKYISCSTNKCYDCQLIKKCDLCQSTFKAKFLFERTCNDCQTIREYIANFDVKSYVNKSHHLNVDQTTLSSHSNSPVDSKESAKEKWI